MSHPQSCFTQTQFHGPSILRDRRRTFASVGVKAQLKQLRETGRYDCFNLKWQPVYEEHKWKWPSPAPVFWDSDVAKWLEGACYLLADAYDAEVDAAVREIAAMIRGAQREDGYLNVYFTVVKPGEQWTDIRDQHELYNAGHLIEAALAHSQYYKTNFLIEVVEKYIRHIRTVIGPGEGQKHAYPGHPEIELALLRLYAATGNEDAYELAKYFIEERGNPKGQDGMHFYDWERKQRGDSPWKRPDAYPTADDHWYNQCHAPILEQQTIEGHAVRAMYLLTGVANLLSLDKLGVKAYDDDNNSSDEKNGGKKKKDKYLEALTRLWDDMVDKKMYLTGGIGARWGWEGFGLDYFLPPGSDEGGCYNETCASIGVVMLAERMLHLDLDARYADVLELCLYNNVMTGASLDGTAFTYVNQLASSDVQPSRREDWFEVSCCPPNLMRLFGSLGGYLWDYGGGGGGGGEGEEEEEGREEKGAVDAFVNVHLYTTAVVTFEVGDGDGKTVALEQKSNWPWDGNVAFNLTAPSSVNTTIRLRIPGWARGEYTLSPAASSSSSSSSSSTLTKGYLTLPPAYTTTNPSFTLRIGGFNPRHIAPHPYTGQRTLALARGPLVYCAEDADNPWAPPHFRDVLISAASPIQEEARALRVQANAERWDCGRRWRCGEGDGDVEMVKEGNEEKRKAVEVEVEDRYVALSTEAWVRDLSAWRKKRAGAQPGLSVLGGGDVDGCEEKGGENENENENRRQLVFIPYYLRANRGGKGHMRVGLLRK